MVIAGRELLRGVAVVIVAGCELSSWISGSKMPWKPILSPWRRKIVAELFAETVDEAIVISASRGDHGNARQKCRCAVKALSSVEERSIGPKR